MVCKAVEVLKVGVIYLFFIAWTIMGTIWFNESGTCLPEVNQYWTLLIWLVLCYLAIALYFCYLLLKYTLRPDQQEFVFGDRSFALSLIGMSQNRGLTQTQIRQIRSHKYEMGNTEDPDDIPCCAICIEPFSKGDSCKKLPDCSHFFHDKCIVEWLQLKNDCPVCRSQVIVGRLRSAAGNTTSTLSTPAMRRRQQSHTRTTSHAPTSRADLNIASSSSSIPNAGTGSHTASGAMGLSISLPSLPPPSDMMEEDPVDGIPANRREIRDELDIV